MRSNRWSDDGIGPVEEAKRNEALQREAKALGLQPWQLRAMRAVPTDVVRDIVNDSRTYDPAPRSMAAKPAGSEEKKPVQRGTGWVNAVPLGPQPGAEHIERIADHFARLDKAARVKQALELAAMGRRAEKMP